jgi:hypothetical protein
MNETDSAALRVAAVTRSVKCVEFSQPVSLDS